MGCPVCYVLQETPLREQARFPYFSGIRLRGKVLAQDEEQSGLSPSINYKRQYLSVLGSFV